jgi:hypothetical protein
MTVYNALSAKPESRYSRLLAKVLLLLQEFVSHALLQHALEPALFKAHFLRMYGQMADLEREKWVSWRFTQQLEGLRQVVTRAGDETLHLDPSRSSSLMFSECRRAEEELPPHRVGLSSIIREESESPEKEVLAPNHCNRARSTQLDKPAFLKPDRYRANQENQHSNREDERRSKVNSRCSRRGPFNSSFNYRIKVLF